MMEEPSGKVAEGKIVSPKVQALRRCDGRHWPPRISDLCARNIVFLAVTGAPAAAAASLQKNRPHFR